MNRDKMAYKCGMRDAIAVTIQAIEEKNPTIYNLKKLAESIESGDEYHGKFFEYKDFYDGVENATETL